MKNLFIKQIIFGLVAGVLFYFMGAFVGLTIGGNFGFMSIGNNDGWEAGAVFFGLLFSVIGSLFGIFTVSPKENMNYLSCILAGVLVLYVELFLVSNSYNLFILFLFLPSLIISLASNIKLSK